MLKQSQGIVIQSIKYGEASRIISIYTKSHGLQSFIAQGLNQKGNLKKTHFQHLNLVDIHYYYKERSGLKRIKDSRLILDNSRLGMNQLYIVMFAAELLRNSIKEEEPNELMFEFLKAWVEKQAEIKNPIEELLVFLLNLSKYLGFYPLANPGKYFNILEGHFQDHFENPSHSLAEQESLLIRNLINGTMDYNNNEECIILKNMLRLYSFHLENFRVPKSLEMLKIMLVDQKVF